MLNISLKGNSLTFNLGEIVVEYVCNVELYDLKNI